MKNKTLALALAIFLSGCSAAPLDELQAKLKQLAFSLFASHGQRILQHALQRYEDGDFAAAETALHAALEEGLARKERVVAHKHLAFIHCAAQRTLQCRSEFLLALRADPRADLDPAEAGHPAWGPVFRSLPR